MALSLDGSGHNAVSAATVNVALTTANTNDIICVVATTNGGPVTSVTATGLTFALKALDPPASATDIELWYAVAAATFSGNITINTTSSAFLAGDAFGVSGADTATIWDGAAVTGNPDPLSISTTNANTFILGAFRGGTASPTSGAGWTQISGADFQLTEYQVVSSTQSGLSVTQTTGAGGANGGIAIAIKQAGSAPAAVLTSQIWM